MNFNFQVFSIRLHYFVLLSIRIVLIIGAMYFFLNSYSWSVLKRNELDPQLTAVYDEFGATVAAQNAHSLAVHYCNSWISAEQKFDNTMGVLCLAMILGTLKFKQEKW
jgi:hypothetical protein